MMPKRIFFSEEWIKNVAVLKDQLKNEDIEKIYDLYGDLLSIKELLETKDKKDLKLEINKTSHRVFADFYLEYAKKGMKVRDIESILDMEYQIIFEKLRYIIYVKTDMKLKENRENANYINTNSEKIWIERVDGRGLNGNIKIYNDNGKIRYDGFFENDMLVSGERYEYLYKDENYLKVVYEHNEAKSINMEVNGDTYIAVNYINEKFGDGYKRIFGDNGELQYKGYLKSGKYNGEGTMYERKAGNESIAEGYFEDGYLKKGIIKRFLLEDTETGYSWYEEKASIEKYEKEQMDERYQEYEEMMDKEFKESVRVGILTVCDMIVENGENKITNRKEKNKYSEEYEYLRE